MNVIRERQGNMDIKLSSPLMIQTISGRYDSEKGNTCVIGGKGSPTRPSYIEDIQFASGVTWDCDAEEAVTKKARHIKRHVARATEQIPEDEIGIIHVGLESHDGPIVESKRFARNEEALKEFDSNEKLLAYVYYHIFDPKVTPDKPWDFGETVRWFSTIDSEFEPLKNPMFVTPDSV